MLHSASNARRGFPARSGWTLAEVLVVIAIIGALSALTYSAISSMMGYTDRLESRISTAKQQMARQRKAGLAQTAPKVVPNQYLVRLKPAAGDPYAQAQRFAQVYLAKVMSVVPSIQMIAVDASASSIAAIKADPAVKEVEHNQYMRATSETIPTGIRRFSAKYYAASKNKLPYKLLIPGISPVKGPAAQPPPPDHRNVFLPGQQRPQPPEAYLVLPDITVAVIDTGVDSTHPDLNVVFSKGFGNPNGEDQDGHGTHVAGTIGARHNTIGVLGVFPGVKLWSLRVLDANGSGSFADLINALDFLSKNASKVQVANLSLGGPKSKAVNDMIDVCSAAGVVMVCAAGNSSADSATFSPASAPTSITVAALADYDGKPGAKSALNTAGPDDTFADFSNYGPYVSVIAPGVDILSTQPGNSYQVLSGTSMACPHVAGLCALIVANGTATYKYPSWYLPGQPVVAPTPDPTPVITLPKGSHRNLFVSSAASSSSSGSSSSASSGGVSASSVIGFPTTPNPAAVRSVLLQMSIESIPGINGEGRSYPLVNPGLPW